MLEHHQTGEYRVGTTRKEESIATKGKVVLQGCRRESPDPAAARMSCDPRML